MNSMLKIRLEKIWFSLTHPKCWSALKKGVVPSVEHLSILRGIDFDLLLDVGANRGQFSLMARMLYPRLQIHSYEPQAGEASFYRDIFHGRDGISLHVHALGDGSGRADLHMSGRADSSSMLPIGALQTKIFPNTREIGTCSIEVRTLDSLPEHWKSAKRAMLKIDVQGFELHVLRGARDALRHCEFVYVECSEVPLYTGQPLRHEIEAFLLNEGFQIVQRANALWIDCEVIQADYLFRRKI